MAGIGLAFSGGGIRSAALCSGVLRRLLDKKVEVDYLSCVSGGGYTGTAYLDWKYKNGNEDDEKWHREFFNHMRNRAGYFCHWEKPLEGMIDTMILLCLFLLITVIQPVIIYGSYACPIAFIIDFIFGKFLRAKLDCDDVAERGDSEMQFSVEPNATTEEIRDHCLDRQGAGDSYTIILFSVLFVLFVVFFVLARRCSGRKRYSTPLSFIHTTLVVFLALTFFPFAIHDFLIKIPSWTQYLFVFIGVMVWFFLPLLRSKTSYVLIIYFYSYIIYWKVYEATLVGIEFSGELFNRFLFLSGFALWIVPLLAASHKRLMHVYNRWRLQKAFYHYRTAGFSGIGLQDVCPAWLACQSRCNQHHDGHDSLDDERWVATRSLNLEDLKDTKPEYLSNVVVNRWKPSEKSDESYELLTMSSTEIDRLGTDPFKGSLGPADIKLSDAMATSAAALSQHMGKYDNSVQGLTRFHTLLGLEMGATMVSDYAAVKYERTVFRILPFLVDIVRGLPLICVPALYYSGDTESSIKAGVISFFVIHFLLAFIAVIDTGKENPNKWERLARWFIVHNSFVHYVRLMFNKENIGLTPPPVMLLSDGGHVENLALLPLLKKRLKKIVVVDGGFKNNEKLYGESLLNALMLARKKLNCAFLSEGGGDVISDLFEKFVKPTEPGKDSCFYRFKVQYFDKDPKTMPVSEGEILLIAPRHPDKIVQKTIYETWGGIGVDLEADRWGPGPQLTAKEADRLTFCCCKCCHGSMCRGLSKWMCGAFPQHSTANQFFTPAMFTAYHREGYRACMESNAAEFLVEGERLVTAATAFSTIDI